MNAERPEGLLLVDKPGGITSHDAVDLVRRAIGTKKVGHAGTLDPMATGLLLIGVGRATRLLRFLGSLSKTYEGSLRLGIETDTLDADGSVTRRVPTAGLTDDAIALAMASKLGESDQVPPAYSAVKVAGRPLYDAARAGEVARADPRRIRVDRFDLTWRDGDEARFTCVVSGGTYVRVLAAEVGVTLGTVAHLTSLRRTAIGAFVVDDASPPDAPGQAQPLERAVAHLPRLQLDGEEAVAASHGRILAPAGLDGPYGVYGDDGRLIGIWRDDGGKAVAEMVLAPAGG